MCTTGTTRRCVLLLGVAVLATLLLYHLPRDASNRLTAAHFIGVLGDFTCPMFSPGASTDVELIVPSSPIVDKLVSFLSRTTHRLPLLLVDDRWLDCLLVSKSCTNGANFTRGTDALLLLLDEHHWACAKRLEGWMKGWNVTTGESTVTLRLNGSTVVIHRMIERPNYVYVEAPTPWAFLPINRSRITVRSGAIFASIDVPSDASFFVWQHRRSTFMECRHDLADELRRKYPNHYAHQLLPTHQVVDDMSQYRDLLYGHRVSAILFGGTALGWLRECSIIPDTTDVDFAAHIDEYSPAVEQELRWNGKFKIDTVFGKPSDSLEVAIFVGGRKMDLFYIYDDAATNGSWVGGMVTWKRLKLRWTYRDRLRPEHTICTADLHGHLFMVACNVERYLIDDYGRNWTVPHHDKNFVWFSSHRNVHEAGVWSKAEWPLVYRTKFK